MGAHSSLVITKSQAKQIWSEHVQANSEASFKEMEHFFDAATDEALYNVCIYDDSTEQPTSEGMVANYVQRYLEDNPSKRPGSLTEQKTTLEEDNRILRELLALRVAGMLLYGDDGELQDTTEQPWIDFRRDSAQAIRRKLHERAVRKLQAQGIILP